MIDLMDSFMKAEAIKKPRSNAALYVLPAKLLLSNLEGLYSDLNKLLSSKKTQLKLDSGEVSLVDSAGVQLLVAFVRSFQAKGGQVEWDNYSVQLYQMADEMGLTTQLGG
jgi:ABC-type transporter Mla MlaB component